ncbi:hypothetical protein FSP39_005496 [Pinctada imbricata]|uniref:RING-type domain-containing protein n=1 Tax=Pinctada imbricata TaxID=66713 RepID=A0AA88YLT2_PINIB|nr:hypothetical protein FSP39_005496 [Pinctada imbricata]
MDKMECDELPLNVPLKCFLDYFTCSICMTELTSTVTTVCGHRYCEKCIKEWVDRSHSCPCCNKELSLTQLFRDCQFDSLISSVNAEKEKAETMYFSSLIDSASDASEKEMSQSSVVEMVLKKHLKNSFAAHEQYMREVGDQFQQTFSKLETETQQAIADLPSHGLSQDEIEQQKEDLQHTLSRRRDSLQRELDTCKQLVADAYDRYLKENMPQFSVLPVRVSINLLDKGDIIPNIVLKPAETVGEKIQKAVEEVMKAKNNPVIKWPDEVRLFMFGPFAKCSPCEVKQIISNILNDGTAYPEVYALNHDSRPILEFNMKPNSEIIIYGQIVCESDMPKQCFINTFKKGGEQKIDYFFCKQCSFKWICRCCMEICHKDHQIIPYIMNHQPEWACCYCPRKKTCILN